MQIAQHGVLGFPDRLMTPALVSGNSGVVSGTSYVVVPTVPPTNGNFMYIGIGGVASRSVISAPSGWTEVVFSGGLIGTNVIYYKEAGSSEPASYTFVFNATLGGSWRFLEFSGIAVQAPIVNTGATSSPSTVTTLSPVTTYSISAKGIAFTAINLDGTGVWSADNSFSNIGGSGEYDTAYKIFDAPKSGEDVNWSTGGVAQVANARIVTFLAKSKILTGFSGSELLLDFSKVNDSQYLTLI
jgi:hypothetical protein